MSTRKVRDGASKPLAGTTTRTKKPSETAKKEAAKTKTSSGIPPKEDEDKTKKRTLKITPTQSKTKVSRPAPVKKTTSTAKQPSSRPVTPPSSRVTKTQFFPSKKMYTNALKTTNKTPVVKITPKEDVSPDTSSMSERPRTATLRKGSIVNKNIVGPDVPKKTKTPITVKVEEPAVEYEDDFDSYESDFEAYDSSDSTTNISSGATTSSETTESETLELTSNKRVSSAGTDDEKKLDSGNYELPESRHRQILDNIKESIEKENNALLANEHNRSNLGSLSDEGFEDAKSLQFINFLGAQKKYKHRKSVELRRKRGEEILSMIRMDHYSFTLFDAAPVPYDTFIKHFGKGNTVQASVQTGEDDLNEEVQTDAISYANKWTQFPATFTKIEENEDFWEVYKCNYLGVGGDVVEKQQPKNNYNESSLEKFLLNTGNLILNLQAERNLQTTESDESNIPFSKGFILYNTASLEILKNRPLNDVCFCSGNSNKILTVHGKRENDERSIICSWNMSNVKAPELLFFAFGEVTCCGFNSECPNLIFGGLTNGSISIWDTKENDTCHQIVDDSANKTRSATYSTEIDYGHCGTVISIHSMISTSKDMIFSTRINAAEVCSLDEDGDIIVWSVIFKEKSLGRMVEKQGLAHWGSVILTINVKISLRKLYGEIDDFKCTDLSLSHHDPSSLYVSTNYGIIIHCLSSGGKTSIKKFLPDTRSKSNCIEMCPFSSDYFLAGFDNGDINFYCRTTERPLMVLSNKDTLEGKSKIQRIQWSHYRPLICYTKDVTNTIHVWNLKESDMFPVFSVPFKDDIVSMKLSSVVTTDDVPEKAYMILATGNGLVYVHLLNEEHDQQPADEFEKDKRRFLNYINRYV